MSSISYNLRINPLGLTCFRLSYGTKIRNDNADEFNTRGRVSTIPKITSPPVCCGKFSKNAACRP